MKSRRKTFDCTRHEHMVMLSNAKDFFDIFRHFHGESEKFTIFSRYVSVSFEFFQVKTDKKAAAQRKILRNF